VKIMAGYIIAAAVLIFLGVLAVRALRFTPEPKAGGGPQPEQADCGAAASHLSSLIQKRTVSSRDEAEVETEEFRGFIGLLPELYPEAHRVLERELVNGFALLYRWKGRGAGDPAVLMAHYDVVAAPPEGWKHPPFAGVIENGVIWGRGAIDTKVTLASILEAVEKLVKEGYAPARDIYLSFSNNEETAGDSTPAIVELFKTRCITPALVVDEGGAIVEGVFPGVSEPVAVVGVSEKGLLDLLFSFESGGGHASTPMRNGLVARLARAVLRLEKRPFRAHFARPTVEMLKTLGRHTPFGYRLVFANLWLFRPLLLQLFTRLGGETNAMCRTTVALTMLEGSKGVNVLPASVKAVANIRIAVNETPEAAVGYIKKVINDPGMKVENLYEFEPSPVSDTVGEAYALVRRVINETYPKAVVTPYIMLGASDSRHFSAISKYVYRFSPLELSKEERETMHAVNESLPVAKLGRSIEFYLRLIRSI
jgi:carboxypeptidase PM20D1